MQYRPPLARALPLTVALSTLALGCTGLVLPPITLSFVAETLELPASALGLFAGLPVPEIELEFPACNLPDPADFDDEIRARAGNVADILTIEAIGLVATELVAAGDDLDFIDSFAIFYKPAAVLGQAQPRIALGSATQPEGGWGGTIRLEPPADVDLLPLLEQQAQNPLPTCPTIILRISGKVPATDVVAEVNLTGAFTVRVGG